MNKYFLFLILLTTKVCFGSSDLILNKVNVTRDLNSNLTNYVSDDFSKPSCTENNNCSIFIGEITNSFILKLNNEIIFKTTDKNDFHTYVHGRSFQINLPTVLLKDLNKIELAVYDIEVPRKIASSIKIVISDYVEVKQIADVDFIKRTGITLLSSYVMLFFSLTFLFILLTTRNKMSLYFLIYSAIGFLYLISFSEIPREFGGHVIQSGGIHFSLRLLQDLSLVVLIFNVFNNVSKVKKYIYFAYTIAISVLFSLSLIGLKNYLVFVFVMKVFAPLVALPMIIGYYLSTQILEKNVRKILSPLFLILMIFQINDLFVFWQLYAGLFFVKWYLPFVVITLTSYFIRNEIITFSNLIFKLRSAEQLSIIASQVSHDIRSPLAALNMTINNLKEIPEQQRITLRAASNRINDIANTLLSHSKAEKTEKIVKNTPKKLQIELLPAILDSIVSEKRVQYRDKMQVEIEADFKNAYGAFANVNPAELSRVISNLINNSVEAFPNGEGRFTLSVLIEKNKVVIVAQDNGKGIPKQILEKLGQMGVTHGKDGTQSGSGLGVYHAKSTIEHFGGQFEVQSTENVGTKIIMTLPLAPAPNWFVEKMKIAPQSQIISLDDDLSIHNVWKGRFQSLGFQQNEISHLTFTSGIDFKDWVNNQPVSQSKNIQKRIYLVDFELLNQKQTGLDLIEELGIGSQSILVTSRYEEINIRERCEKLGVQLIPKGMAGLVPIELKQPLKMLNAILIDDDPLMGYVWTDTAKRANKAFEWFNDPDLFYAQTDQIDPSVEIYIDVSLGKNIKGQDVAIKLEQMGFLNLHLATGYPADSVDKPSVVKSVIGKDCPL